MSHRLKKISARLHRYKREEDWWLDPDRRDSHFYFINNSLVPRWLKSLERDSLTLAMLVHFLTKNTKRTNELKQSIDAYIAELLLRYPRG